MSKKVSFAPAESNLEIEPQQLEKLSNQYDKIPPELSYLEKNTPDPKPVSQYKPIESFNRRVARPIRHIKYIPTKEVSFSNKQTELNFNYEKIKLPISAGKILVQIRYASINPIDLKIINSYNINLSGNKGIGREFVGEVYSIGSAVTEFDKGDKVVGLYYHTDGKGTLSTHLLINPKVDKIVKISESVLKDDLNVDLDYDFNEDKFKLEDEETEVDAEVEIEGENNSEETVSNGDKDNVKLEAESVSDSKDAEESDAVDESPAKETGLEDEMKEISIEDGEYEEEVEEIKEPKEKEVSNEIKSPEKKGTVEDIKQRINNAPAKKREDKIPTLAKFALFPVAFNMAKQCLSHSVLAPSSNVLINGGSTTIGITLIQLIRSQYNINELNTINSIKKNKLMKFLGVDNTFNYNLPFEGLLMKNEQPVTIYKKDGTLVREINKHIDGDNNKKYDLIIDLIGGTVFTGTTLSAPALLTLLKPKSSNSCYVTTVGTKKSNYAKDDLNTSFLSPWSQGSNFLSNIGNSMLAYNYYYESLKPKQSYLEQGLNLFSRGELIYKIDEFVEWKEFKRVLGKLKNRENDGKIILEVEDF